MTTRDYASASMAVMAAAYAGIALASWLAVRTFGRAFDEISTLGGGIGAMSLGIWQASRIPLAAAWIALLATLLALALAIPAARRERASATTPRVSAMPWLAGLALGAGVISVVLFRGAMAFVMEAVTPGSQPLAVARTSVADAVAVRLFTASVGSAACFLLAVVLAAVAFRAARGSMRGAVLALVVSAGVTAAMVVDLSAYSGRFRRIALDGHAHATQARATSLPVS